MKTIMYYIGLIVNLIYFQDWWNIVVWDDPSSYYNLDCGFNFQLKKEFNQPPFDKVTLEKYCFEKLILYFSAV